MPSAANLTPVSRQVGALPTGFCDPSADGERAAGGPDIAAALERSLFA